MSKCVRCDVDEAEHDTDPSACHRFEQPAPLWLRALTRTLGRR